MGDVGREEGTKAGYGGTAKEGYPAFPGPGRISTGVRCSYEDFRVDQNIPKRGKVFYGRPDAKGIPLGV